MLDRVLEPEVMDTEEEARDYDSMDHSQVNRVFIADFLSTCPSVASVLDVGTGTAQIPIALSRRIPRAKIVAVDLADHMLALARANVEGAELARQITIEKADAKRFTYSDSQFEAVISNSIIHHMPEPFVCFAEMHRVCEKGGILFVRDLLRPSDLETLDRLVNVYAAGANDHQRQMFGDSLHAALSLPEVRAMVGKLGYSPETVEQTSDRHWTFSSSRL